MTKYKVLKPCVIESEYYDIGDTYEPSKHMSDEALGCLLFFNFLDEIKKEEEYDAIPESIKHYILSKLESLTTDLNEINFAAVMNKKAPERNTDHMAETLYDLVQMLELH